jgi:ribosome-binding factor A
MSGEVKRAVRVAGQVRAELVVSLRALRDPRLASVLVSRVEMTDDLQLARVFVRLEVGGEDERTRRAALKVLEAASGRLRREVGQAVGLRYVPELRFRYDEAPDAVNRVEELLREIDAERKERG